MLFIEDFQLVKPEFLEMLNSLISSGEAPGLYTQEEIDSIFAQNEFLKQEFPLLGNYEAFYKILLKTLRIVLSLDFSNPAFQKNTSQNPSLFSKCQVIWQEQLSQPSLQQVLEISLKSMMDKENPLFPYFLEIHKEVPHAMPKDYFKLISYFRAIFEQNTASRLEKKNHLQKGLTKLQEASALVDQLQQQAQIQ